MRERGWSWQTEWHYVNTPYLDEVDKEISDYPDYKDNTPQNLTLVISDLVSWLKGSKGYNNSYTYQKIT